MAFGTEVLRPTSTVSNTWPSLAGATAHGATSDDSDATYIRNNTSTTGVAVFEITNTALTTQDIVSIDVRLRARSETSAAGRVRVGLELGGTQVFAAYHTSVPTSATNYEDAVFARPGGGVWTVADLDALRVIAEGDEVTSDGIRCFELFVDVNYTDDGFIGGSQTSGTGTAIALIAPTGTAVGDMVYVAVAGNGQETLSDNNGATPFTEAPNFSDYKPNTSNGHVLSIFYRVIESGDPTTYNFTLSASGRYGAAAGTFRGNGLTFDVAPNTTNAANADNADTGALTVPAITTLVANTFVVGVCTWDTGAIGTITTPTGYTIVVNANGGGQPVHMSYKLQASAGTTGTAGMDNTEFGARMGVLASIKEVVGGSSIKTFNGLAYASTKTVNGLAIASVKTKNGLA